MTVPVVNSAAFRRLEAEEKKLQADLNLVLDSLEQAEKDGDEQRADKLDKLSRKIQAKLEGIDQKLMKWAKDEDRTKLN